MERPRVVAADVRVLFQQQDAQVGPVRAQAPGDQAVGQAAAGEDQVVVRGAHAGSPARPCRGARAGARPSVSSTMSAARAVPPARATHAASGCKRWR